MIYDELLVDLQRRLELGIINITDASEEEKRIRTLKIEDIKKQVDAIHNHPFGNSKPGIRYTVVNINAKERKKIYGKTDEIIYEKLFDFYKLGKKRIPKSLTFQQAFELFIEDYSRDCSTTRPQRIKQEWNRFWKDLEIANMPVSEITQVDVKKAFRQIVGDKKINKKTFNEAKCVAKMTFDYLIDEGIVNVNVVAITTKNKLHFLVDNSEKPYITPEWRKAMIEYINKFDKKDIYDLAIEFWLCFCVRIGDLLALKWDDIEDDYVHIWHSITYQKIGNKNHVAVDSPHDKCGLKSANRRLRMSKLAQSILKQIQKINGNAPYIFNSAGDKPISVNRLNYRIKKYCTAIGIPYLSTHAQRFGGITQLYDAGVDAETIRRIAGHSSTSMTEHYNRTKGVITVDENIYETIFS